MKKLVIFILITFFLAKLGFTMEKKEKLFSNQFKKEEKVSWEQYCITFIVYKYLDEGQLKDKELRGSKKKEIFKKIITIYEDQKSYIEDFIINKNIHINFKFDFKEFLILKIYINDKESIVFQNKAIDFELNFKAAKNENYLIETTFVLSRVGVIPPGVGMTLPKKTKKKIKRSRYK